MIASQNNPLHRGPLIARDSTEFLSLWLTPLRKLMSVVLFIGVVWSTYGWPGIRVAYTSVNGRADMIVSARVRLLNGDTMIVVGRCPWLTFWRDGKMRYPLGRL